MAEQEQQQQPQLNEQQKNQVVQHLKKMMAEKDQLYQKIIELSSDGREHKLVLEVLQPLDKERKAWRKVGGVLMERTVGQCEEATKKNLDSILGVVEELEKNYETKTLEVEDFQRKFNLSVNGMPPPGPRRN